MTCESRAPARVLLILGALNGGGAERVALSLAEHCDASEAQISLGLLRHEGDFIGETSNVTLIGEGGSLWTAPWRIAAMARAFDADIIMSFGMGVNLLTWLALRLLGGDRPAWICRDDSDIDAEVRDLKMPSWIAALVRLGVGIAYRSADCVLGVSAEVTERLKATFNVGADRLTYIHNPVHIDRIKALARAEPPAPKLPFVVAAGRLTHQKGFDLLIQAFAQCAGAADHHLVILGQGPLRNSLVSLATQLGVDHRVHFPGFQSNPWAWMAQSDVFVLSSRWEGFGNVVAEAMVCGVPVLAFDCDFGPREQISNNEDGVLIAAADQRQLAEALGNLLRDPSRRRRLASAALQRVQRLDVRDVARRYELLFRAMQVSQSPPSGAALLRETSAPAPALAAE